MFTFSERHVTVSHYNNTRSTVTRWSTSVVVKRVPWLTLTFDLWPVHLADVSPPPEDDSTPNFVAQYDPNLLSDVSLI